VRGSNSNIDASRLRQAQASVLLTEFPRPTERWTCRPTARQDREYQPERSESHGGSMYQLSPSVAGCTSFATDSYAQKARPFWSFPRFFAVGSIHRRGLLLFAGAVRYVSRSDARADRSSTPPWWSTTISHGVYDESNAQRPRHSQNPFCAS
jgi:hypothetical protein